MADGTTTIGYAGTGGGLLDRSRTVAAPGFNRWLVPPCALAIHLCIGMAYGFSVFWLPMTRAIGITKSIPAPPGTGMLAMLFTTSFDWRVADVTVLYTLFFVFLGSAAAVCGGWLERAGPRKAGVYAAVCWAGGLAVTAVGVYIHQLWLMWLGAGVLGGIGLGLGYISPVSTLIMWFPDKRGMATGMAIMGFGGGALIGAPLANMLMNHFRTATSVGVWQTLLVFAAGYFVVMVAGSFGYRVPPVANWAPEGYVAPPSRGGMITSRNVHLKDAHKTPQFWLIWAALTLNVSAGIGVISVASPMLQEIFAGKLIHAPTIVFGALSPEQKVAVAAIAAGFVGLLSLFNIGGRFFWATISDKIGRKTTYATFFLLGIVLYALSPYVAHAGSIALFVLFMGVILSMYGGGFATAPAYLADLFGTKYVGAIHGRLLTAWSTAGIIGPLVITQIRQAQLSAGVPRALVYDRTLYILAAFLAAGFVCNLLVRPVADRWFIEDTAMAGRSMTASSAGIGRGGMSVTALIAWALVGLPTLWGIWITLESAAVMFR